MRNSKWLPLSEVTIEDPWETLMGVHRQLSDGGRNRMDEYLLEHDSHVPSQMIQLFLYLCQICRAIRGRKSKQKIAHKRIIPDAVGKRG